jgi:hypothetical protein
MPRAISRSSSSALVSPSARALRSAAEGPDQLVALQPRDSRHADDGVFEPDR